MSELTIERLFGDPPLTGNAPSQLDFSPDGKFVAFLRAADDDRERLDLWRYDIGSGVACCWLNAAQMIAEGVTLSAAEKASRERKRLFSSGLTQFEFGPDGEQLLIPIDGAGYLLDVATDKLTRFTSAGDRQTDFQFSPGGHFISYVRANDLYYYDLDTAGETQVTRDGCATISNGIADFIAQEEMHRFEGHWWSHDEQFLAFTRTDDSVVALSQRYEIDADAFNVVAQRYPFAGAPNADVELKVFTLATTTTQDINYRNSADDYLARVTWWDNELAIQTQSRDQHSLSLEFHDPATGGRRTALRESSDTWINLHDNFKTIDSDRFLWTSERDGHSHLYLYTNGEPHQLTRGVGQVNHIVHASTERVLFSGWLESPVEQHLYAVDLDGGEVNRLTTTDGWHELHADRDGSRVLDRLTSLTDPGRLWLRSIDDASQTAEIAAQPLAAGHPYFPFLDAHCAPILGVLNAEDGQPLHYRLTVPQQIQQPNPEDGCPLVIYVYGGPGVQRVRNQWPPLMLQLFAQRGIGVLELDNRGTGNRGTTFEAPIYGALGHVEVADQVVAAQFAQSLSWVDADRIGVFGHSYGGFLTLMCLAKAPEIFKAGVSVAPVTQWQLYDTHYTERYLATPATNPAGYESSSVFPYLEQLQGKLLLMHGMADDNVLFTHSTKLFKALQAKNIAFEMMTYPGAKHSLQETEVAIHRFTLILDFFERNL